MGLNLEARASSGFGSDGVNAAVVYFGDCSTRNADQVMVVGRFARDIGVSAVRQVNPLNKVLVSKKFEEAEDGGAPDTEVALISIGEKVCGGEVPLPARNQGGEFTARPGQTNPRLVKRLEQLRCHRGILPELRLSLNTRPGRPNEESGASAGMIHP